ncbi:MAG: bi-domain-containing oxidoreductase [Gammaproteobacteria bacterium]|nr:bi-domain-containing oxidoreductase [Gammaproteobacteria bacterium]
MKQVLQSLRKGNTRIIDAPIPNLPSGHLLIATTTSLISAGTERMLVDFGKASYVSKMKQQPEKVKEVLSKIKTDGLFSTFNAVQSKLDQPLPLGYCHVGQVEQVGHGVQGFQFGQRVVSNGAHAEVVQVPANLCARIPDSVANETAVFTVVASIGLQGIRLANVVLGESVVVIGAGLIGLLSIQLLKAQGCRVLAIDMDCKKLALAEQFGAEICDISTGADPIEHGVAFSRGHGVDAVLITAATPSNDPMTQAARMSRKRGRIVLVGVTGLSLNRADFYEKELSFQVSCSYGPGRYDPIYEQKGIDYPYGLVRWTAQRNFEAVLDMMADGRLNVAPLITHRFELEDAAAAYQVLCEERQALGIVLQYGGDIAARMTQEHHFLSDVQFDPTLPAIGCIGAGNYAARVLIPAFKATAAQLHTIVSANGLHGSVVGEKTGFMKTSTDVDTVFANESINTIVIATRHDSHARFVVKALQASKHVFVEKPLALDLASLSEIEAAYHLASMQGNPTQLMVGFNRRYAPHVQTMKRLLQTTATPKTIIMTINAGAVPKEHWTQDSVVGGGRIIGEGCHFIDLMRYIVGTAITSYHISSMQHSTVQDTVSIILNFQDGSMGTIHYFANGAKSFPKERVEVFTGNRILQLDNFRCLRGFGWPTFHKKTLWRQDKGQMACVKAFLSAIETGVPAIPLKELFEVARVAIHLSQDISQGVEQ